MKSKYFRVTCKCGHVGRQHFIRIDFPVCAHSKKEAAEIARYIPRVKHDYKDAVLNCVEIDFEEYEILKRINDNDQYLKCTNIQEQSLINEFESRLEVEPKYLESVKKTRRNAVEFKNKKRRIAEQSYISYQMDYENWSSFDDAYVF